MNIDLLPTIANLIGADLPEQKIDGKDIWPLIAGEKGAENPHDGYWYYYKQNELQAVSQGKWKLYLPHTYRTLDGGPGGDKGLPVPYKSAKTQTELYDLATDISETKDVSGDHPEVVKELLALAEKARAELGDSLTKRKGSGSREPGRLTEEEWKALEKTHWPNGRPNRSKRKK